MSFYSFDSSGTNAARVLGIPYTPIPKPMICPIKNSYSKHRQVESFLHLLRNEPVTILDVGVSGATSNLFLKKFRDYLYTNVIHKHNFKNFSLKYFIIIPGTMIFKMNRYPILLHQSLKINQGAFHVHWRQLRRNCCAICKKPCEEINLPEHLGEVIVIESVLAYTFEASSSGIGGNKKRKQFFGRR
jgi:hypothetical protein